MLTRTNLVNITLGSKCLKSTLLHLMILIIQGSVICTPGIFLAEYIFASKSLHISK